MFSKIWNSFLFQGNLNKKKYFEGWYYKMVTSDQSYTLALIPGISLNEDNTHAFVQVFITSLDSGKKTIKTDYIVYEINDFSFDRKNLKLTVDKNDFFTNKIKLEINKDQTEISGELEFKDIIPIRRTIIRPSIMGFFAYIRFMECYHGVISLTHNISGKLKLNGKEVNFDGGKGYIEKDWGKSFPESYVWMQSNHFSNSGTCLMLSHATIPFLGLKFKGLIAVLYFNKKEYRFATYNFSRVKVVEVKKNYVHYVIKKFKYKLEIEAWNSETTNLKSPKEGAMNQTIKEGLSGEIKINLYHKSDLIYSDTGLKSGLEIMMHN